MPRRPGLPKDPSQRAKAILDMATGRTQKPKGDDEELTDAQKFARKGGLRGGKARSDKLSSKRRTEIATIAARARWEK
jgi:hypothetical protein